MAVRGRKGYVSGDEALRVWKRLQARAFPNEAAFQREVIKRAEAKGWRVWWHWRSFNSPKGHPDLMLIRNGTLLFRELKMPGEIPTPEQVECIAMLRACNVDADTIYPADLEAFTVLLDTA